MSPPSDGATPIKLIDLAAQQQRMGGAVEAAIAAVLSHGQYIMGPEVGYLEQELSEFCGAQHTVTCGSGTDALLMALLALGIGSGDAVFVPTFTFAATAEVVVLAGATPVFVDSDPSTFNLDCASLESAVPVALAAGLRPRAVIPVDLFGQPADYDAVGDLARRHDLVVVADAAQSFGATWGGAPVGTLGAVTCTSFFPAKPLGCYGDGGAIFTDDAELAARLRSVRVHGQGSHKYENVRVGLNGRLDTIQAAVLREKLKVFPDELVSRRRFAQRYDALLGDVAVVPMVRPEATSAWAQYTVLTERRDGLARALADHGVPTAVYYPTPLHRQPAYDGYPVAAGGLAEAERLAGSVLSLPMHPYLSETIQDRVVEAVQRLLEGGGLGAA